MGKPSDPNKAEPDFESYKLIVEDLSRIREQRAREIGSYLTINSVILAASGLLLKETQFAITWEALILVPLLVAGVIATLRWMLLINQYTELVDVRVANLKKIESTPAMVSRNLSLFREEEEALGRRANEDRMMRYVDKRRFLPAIFLGLYFIALVCVGGAVGAFLLGSALDSLI